MADTKQSVTNGLVFNNIDLFADADANGANGDRSNTSSSRVANGNTIARGIVHIRAQQRNGKKSITTIQGLAKDLDFKKILRALKKTFCTNGTILKDDQGSKVLQILGDKRYDVKDFFLKTHICEKEELKVHGF